MTKKEPISKKELQLKLYKMGASVNLIQMPAVIERLHQEYISNKTKEFDIGENGEIITNNGIFREKENLEAEYISEELKIDIDSFGMEKRVQKTSTKSITYRKEGKIIYDEPFDGLYFGPYNFEYSDNAIPVLDDIFEYATEYQDNLSLKGSLEENMGYLLMNYPQTEGWFLQKGFLSEESKEKNETIKNALEATKTSLERKLNYVPDDSTSSVFERPLSQKEKDSIKSEMSNIQSFINQENISFPRKNFSRKESEENRLVYYYEQIQRCKQEEESEEQKIALLRRFVNEKCPRIPGAKKKIISKMSDLSENPIKYPKTEKENIVSNSETVLSKGRKTLDYMKESLEIKESLRKNMKNAIITEYATIPVLGKKAKVVIVDSLNKFLSEKSRYEEKTNNIDKDIEVEL